MISLLSWIAILAAIALPFVSRLARKRRERELDVLRSHAQNALAEVRAVREILDWSENKAAFDRELSTPRSPDSISALVVADIDRALSSASHRKVLFGSDVFARDLVFERDLWDDGDAAWTELVRSAEASQESKDRSTSFSLTRHADTGRLTEAEIYRALSRMNAMRQTVRGSRRRERGVCRSEEVPGWAARAFVN